MNVPMYAELSSNHKIEINYLCNIRSDKDYNIKYLEEKKLIILRNCDATGTLLDLTKPKSSFQMIQPWILLTVKSFKDKVRSAWSYVFTFSIIFF
jgi:hypothetical protein